MKLLITGASGLLGISLALEAMREHEVTGMDRGRLKSAPFPVLRADLLQSRTLESAIDSAQPDWLINCAALANLDLCEQHPDQAKILNADVPTELARICSQRGIRYVHISTDAVFDWRKSDYYT